MEHQFLPNGASFGNEDRVAYNEGIDYSLVPFLDYPEHEGYTFFDPKSAINQSPDTGQ